MTYFIKEAIEHPGRVRGYIREKYGAKAFTLHGYKEVIKPKYLRMALTSAKKRHNTSLERAVMLAERLEGYAKARERER